MTHIDTDTDDRTHDAAPVKTTNEARQGVTGQGVRGMLFWGCAAIVVGFVIVYLVFFAGSPPPH